MQIAMQPFILEATRRIMGYRKKTRETTNTILANPNNHVNLRNLFHEDFDLAMFVRIWHQLTIN